MTPNSDIARRYDVNASRYDDATRYNRDAARRLVASLPDGRYANVLDVGCGTGFASVAMVQRFGPARITGVDVSAQMLEQMRRKLAEVPGVTLDLHVADVLAMPVPERAFDCVLASMALHWFPSRDKALAAMAGKVSQGGVLGLVAPGPGHDREYVEVLRTVVPPVPASVIDVFGTAQVFPDEVEDALSAVGLDVRDVWVETRHRRVPPDRYMERITTVGSHVWSRIMGPEEAAAMIARITDRVRRAAGPRGFEYTFTKTYAVACRPR
jgi:ubiquinone/menaquinone biosynthesis C-methylase UbiE